MPLEADVKLLREFCVREINNLINVEKLFQSDYVYLSKLIYTRLLTFNARRGGEPGKLTLTDWAMVENDRWKRKEDLERLVDPVERTLAERLKLCYIEGKKKKKGCFFEFFYIGFLSHCILNSQDSRRRGRPFSISRYTLTGRLLQKAQLCTWLVGRLESGTFGLGVQTVASKLRDLFSTILVSFNNHNFF